MKTLMKAFRRQTEPANAADPEVIPSMALQERIDVRRQAILDCAHQVLFEWGFMPGAFRLKAAPADDRGHRYDLMVDIPNDLVSQTGNRWLAPVVTALIQQAKDLGLVIVGVYWRPCSELSFFEVTIHDPSLLERKAPPNLSAQPLVISGKQYATDLSPLADH